ncbi:hypothetical protein CIY_04340 [Butyrivibrio fibrisolvens 16/4]|nr:hypothetical protein CIY_04340 [Butyrivibrio fibrisolvens 16/4]
MLVIKQGLILSGQLMVMVNQ